MKRVYKGDSRTSKWRRGKEQQQLMKDDSAYLRRMMEIESDDLCSTEESDTENFSTQEVSAQSRELHPYDDGSHSSLHTTGTECNIKHETDVPAEICHTEELDLSDTSSDSESCSSSYCDDFYDVDEEDDFKDVFEYEDSEYEEYSKKLLPGGDEMIYEGSSVSVGESALMIIKLFLHFKLSYACMQKVIEIIIAHLPDNNKVVRSVHLIRKLFGAKNQEIRKNRMCLNCKKWLKDEIKCTDRNCTDAKTSSFLTFSLTSQIKRFFQRESFMTMLQSRFSRKKNEEENLEDILDGRLYKMHSNFLSEKYNFSLSYYTDGVQIFKSAKSSMWPLFFQINELPFKKRFLPENTIFGGLWFDGEKPDFNTFVLPLFDELVNLKKGINISLNYLGGKVITSKGIILNGGGDSPARAAMCNLHQHSGFFSCLKCLIKGKTITKQKRSSNNLNIQNTRGRSKVIFPFTDAPLRTTSSAIRDAKLALQQGVAINGVKGATILSKITPDFVRSMGIDAMHCVYAGCGSKRIIELLFKKDFKNNNFSLFNSLDIIDTRLRRLKPPNFINRAPRPLSTHLPMYKSSEFKSWFFYYAIPVLYNVMCPDYLHNYFLLIHAIFLLSQDSVSLIDVETARKLIIKYVKEFEVLYGEEHMSSNVHSLLHLCDCVLDLGPLFVTSCFPLEDLNGRMKRLVNGPRHAELKIYESFFTLQSLPVHIEKLDNDSKAKKFITSLKVQYCKKLEQINISTFSIGKYSLLENISILYRTALNDLLYLDTNYFCEIFYRLQKNGVIYVSQQYSKSLKSISYCVRYEDCKIGFIECFLKVRYCTCKALCKCDSHFFAMVKRCLSSSPRHLEENEFITELSITDVITAVDLQNIQDICVLSVVEGRYFCIKRVNSMEME